MATPGKAGDAALDQPNAFVRDALRDRERTSIRRLTRARIVVFSAIFFWLWGNYGTTIAFQNAPYLALFILNGFILLFGVERLGWARTAPFVTILFDCLLLAATLLAPGRTYPVEWPWATVLRQPSFLYWLIIPVLASLTFRPLLVLWAGFCVVAVWGIGVSIIVSDPSVVTTLPDPNSPPGVFLEIYLSPNYVHLDDTFVRVFLTLLLTAILALGALQVRRLLFRQAEVARQRANLARFVAPNLVDQLAVSDRPFGDDRQIMATVMFVDIRGFTALAEDLSRQEAMTLLRSFHGLMADQIFAHGGTLDKFIGDGVMATFGTPEPRQDDASRALQCALAMLTKIRKLNARSGGNQKTIHVGIGIHYGPVIMGEIGSTTRLEFTVIGDTVNVASRIEDLTGALGEPLLVSAHVVEQVRQERGDTRRLRPIGSHTLRGRAEAIELWGLQQGSISTS